MEKIPSIVMSEDILKRLDLESLCSLACVNKALHFLVVSQALPSLASLNLSTLYPDSQTLNHILQRCRGLKSLTLNCLRLRDSSLCVFLGPHLLELNLLGCSSFSYQILASIGKNCPNLRVLTLELADQQPADVLDWNLAQLCDGCLELEFLSLKIRWTGTDGVTFQFTEFFPPNIKTLKLKPVLEQDAIHLISNFKVARSLLEGAHYSVPVSPASSAFALQSLSLVLDIICDWLITTINDSLPFLVDLDLEDRPHQEPEPHHDLTNVGLQALCSFQHLRGLSLVRSRQNYQGSFKRINDVGMFLLAEGCKDLESVRLGGFSKVSDAGFAAILHSCQSLKKFEVRNVYLSDLTFLDLGKRQYDLVEVRLSSCNLITSETVKELCYSGSLEVLDLGGCKSIADSCLSSISRLSKLNALNLTGADITDNGLSVFSQASPPITCLSLRGCKRVTDKGVSHLLHGGMIGKTLTNLDLGYMPGISDKAISTICAAGTEITELCIRCCFYVTDASLKELAGRKMSQDGSKPLRRLDLYNCIGLSAYSLRWLQRPWFSGLHWIGIGQTRLAGQMDSVKVRICEERPWLTICSDCCEMGCHDGWQFHEVE